MYIVYCRKGEVQLRSKMTEEHWNAALEVYANEVREARHLVKGHIYTRRKTNTWVD